MAAQYPGGWFPGLLRVVNPTRAREPQRRDREKVHFSTESDGSVWDAGGHGASDLTVEARPRGIKLLTLSRRGALGLLGVALARGCTTEADRTNKTFFDAVRNDPLYQWHPGWTTKVVDNETPIGGPYPDSGPRLVHSVYATHLPGSAKSDASAMAVANGWALRDDSRGYERPIGKGGLWLWVILNVSAAAPSLDMEFIALRP